MIETEIPELRWTPRPWLYYLIPPPFSRRELEAANAQFGPLDQWAWDAVARWERRKWNVRRLGRLFSANRR
jgi:hypothetical protein